MILNIKIVADGSGEDVRRKETWLRVPDPFYLPRVCLWLYVAASIDPDPWPQPGTERPHNLSFHPLFPPSDLNRRSLSYFRTLTCTLIPETATNFPREPCLEFETKIQRRQWLRRSTSFSLVRILPIPSKMFIDFSLMSRVVEILINHSVRIWIKWQKFLCYFNTENCNPQGLNFQLKKICGHIINFRNN